jgi:mono/diheme cytochrome c family protein
MPKILIYLGVIAIVLAMVPPALIARARTAKTAARRIHFIQDMDNQARFRAQHANELFADGRAARPPVAGTVARGSDPVDTHFHTGVVTAATPDGRAWATTLPRRVERTMETLLRGQERFGIYCAPCHGASGYGDGPVHVRANTLMNNPAIGNGTTWVQPKSIHEATIREQPIGQVFNTITNGIRNMAGYASQIPADDRWAIAAYVKALQRSQNARPDDVPAGVRTGLEPIDLIPVEEE